MSDRRNRPANRWGCKPTEDVCVEHDTPLECRHGCKHAKPHDCKDKRDRAAEERDPRRALTDEQLNTLVEDLRGTCGDIDEHLPEGIEFDDLTHDDCALLDDEIMKCDECGWWVESGLINDNGRCDECAEEAEGE